MIRLSPRSSGLLAIALLASLVRCGASGPSSSDTPADHAVPETRNRFTAQPTLPIAEVTLEPGEPLQNAFERARQAYRRENIETFDPRRAYATSAARDFAWYFTANDPDDPFGRTQHVFFVVTSPWSESRARDFLLSYVVMPGAPVTEVGRPWFTFYSAEEPPFAARFIFSNTARGALEAAILSELGGTGWPAARAPDIAEAVRGLLGRFGLAEPDELATACPPALDDLFSSLPRPGPEEPAGVFGADYAPEGTLAAIGLLVGESIRTELAGAAEWEADDGRIYPRLRVRGVAEGILRPIPILIEFYLADASVLPSDYCHRVLANLQDSAAGGDE